MSPLKISNVLVTTKKTALEYFKEKSDFLEDALPAEDLKEVRAGHDAHYASLEHVRKVLAGHGVSFCRSYMPYTEYEDFKDKDLIVCVGGDGTVLNSAQYVLDDTPVLTVRSDKKSVGVLCEIEAEDFEGALDRIIADRFTVEKWTRAEAQINSKRMFALNEVYVGVRHSPSMARYELKYNGQIEAQMSSGVVVATGTGSTAWYGNIPGSDGPFPRTAKELRFIVREHNVSGRFRLTKGVLKEGQRLEVSSKMNVDGCISFDGDYAKKMFDFLKGQKVEILTSPLPVNIVKLG